MEKDTKARAGKLDIARLQLAKNPRVIRPGVEPSSPWWETSRLTAQPSWPRAYTYLTPTKMNWIQFPAGSLPGFCTWESYRTTLQVGKFSHRSPISPALAFRCYFMLTSLRPHLFSRSRFSSNAAFAPPPTLSNKVKMSMLCVFSPLYLAFFLPIDPPPSPTTIDPHCSSHHPNKNCSSFSHPNRSSLPPSPTN
ncbi:hypothetical protein PR048_028210 [Dryococelus australis]|uniref:Uncharacterized protein n=1 Tax=Dryococelus australis TaxID=614101 RepID=A0ABQ9GIM6_9NEOP|nr:hypothetical protein PR048_028210 [Dryococelus australis]